MSRYTTHNTRTSSNRKSPARAAARKRNSIRKSNAVYITVFMVAVFLFSTFVGTGATATKVSETECYRVTTGDTLWEIAAKCNTSNKDVRNIIDDIMILNNMTSAQLHTGDIIVVPVY